MPIDRVFMLEEWELVRDCLRAAERMNPAEAAQLRAGLEVLCHLVKALARCPEVLGSQRLGGERRSAATLVRLLCRQEGDLFRQPTKAVLGKSFLVAKINFLFALSYLSRSTGGAEPWEERLREVILLNVFLVLCEELFMGVLQDGEVPLTMRSRAARHLAQLWDHRLSRSLKDHARVVFALWSVKSRVAPTFGALMGVTELLRLSRLVHPVWLDFLQDRGGEPQSLAALEEFGLGSESGVDYRLLDARELYRFHRRRKDAAAARKLAGLPGPQRTIEDMLLCYLLGRNGRRAAASAASYSSCR